MRFSYHFCWILAFCLTSRGFRLLFQLVRFPGVAPCGFGPNLLGLFEGLRCLVANSNRDPAPTRGNSLNYALAEHVCLLSPTRSFASSSSLLFCAGYKNRHISPRNRKNNARAGNFCEFAAHKRAALLCLASLLTRPSRRASPSVNLRNFISPAAERRPPSVYFYPPIRLARINLLVGGALLASGCVPTLSLVLHSAQISSAT